MSVEVRSKYRFPNSTDEHDGWLSPSQVTSYLACPRCFYYERVMKYPKAMAIDLPIGGSVHKAVEYQRHHLIAITNPNAYAEGDDPNSVQALAIEAAAEHFSKTLTVDEETPDLEIMLDLKDFPDEGAAKDAMVRFARFLLPEIAKLDLQRGLIATEVEIADLEVENPWPFLMKGRIDGLYGDRETLAVSMGEDLKTSKKQEAPGLAAAIQTGIYDSFLGGVTWAVDVMAKTKAPSFQTYYANGDGLFTPDHHSELRDLVLDVAGRIAAGDFPARPGYLCHYDHGYPVFSLAVQGFA